MNPHKFRLRHWDNRDELKIIYNLMKQEWSNLPPFETLRPDQINKLFTIYDKMCRLTADLTRSKEPHNQTS